MMNARQYEIIHKIWCNRPFGTFSASCPGTLGPFDVHFHFHSFCLENNKQVELMEGDDDGLCRCWDLIYLMTIIVHWISSLMLFHCFNCIKMQLRVMSAKWIWVVEIGKSSFCRCRNNWTLLLVHVHIL